VFYDIGIYKISNANKIFVVQTLFRIESDCQAKRYKILEKWNRNVQLPYTYDPFKAVDSRKYSDQKWIKIKSRSVYETILKYICNQKIKYLS